MFYLPFQRKTTPAEENFIPGTLIPSPTKKGLLFKERRGSKFFPLKEAPFDKADIRFQYFLVRLTNVWLRNPIPTVSPFYFLEISLYILCKNSDLTIFPPESQ